jgi:cytochrome c
MSDLGFNKIAGAVLATGLALLGLRELSDAIYKNEPAKKPGYAIQVAEETTGGGAEAADVPPDWGTVLPVADVNAGQQQSTKCVSCHSFAPGGANGTGPDNYGVVGRKPGTHPGFAYSSAMTEFGAKTPAWDYDHLYEFLKSPQGYIPGTKMTFVGIKNPQDRINLIAWLRLQSPSPAPIPPPNPKAAATAPAASSAPAAVTGAPASGGPAVVGTGGPASNAGAQAQTPKSGAAAAPTETKPGPGQAQGSGNG